MTSPDRAPTPEQARDARFTLVMIGLMVLLNLPAAFFNLQWWSAAFNTALVSVVFLVHIVRHRSDFLLRFMIFGLAAGFTELIADWWLVHHTGSLVYAPGEPMIAASPFYMPFAWMLILLQMGVLGQWLYWRFGFVGATITVAAVSGINIPLYEQFAKMADWWIYQNTPMIFSAPWYIIVGEALLGLPLVWLGIRVARASPAAAVAWGVVQGLVILVAYVIAWWLVGPCSGAVLQLAC
ncbi:MAG: hypothetical protein AAGD06_14745 [Acidobacteriota bacterium]